MSVSSYEGGGQPGHLGLIMTNDKYFAVATDVFPSPANLGAASIIVVGMTADQITETNRVHTKATRVYSTYHNMDQAFKNMCINAFEDPFLNALSDEIVGYVNCTSLRFVSHLLMYYAMISLTELTQNYEHLNTPYDPNQPIKTRFQQIQDALAFAVAGGQSYGYAMIVNFTFTLVLNMGLFHDACRMWQARAAAGKLWVQFKIDFTSAHREFRLSNQTEHQYGFNSDYTMI
jgi:hypothetical protein